MTTQIPQIILNGRMADMLQNHAALTSVPVQPSRKEFSFHLQHLPLGDVLTLAGEEQGQRDSLLYESSASEHGKNRKVDHDVANTTLDFSEVSEDQYLSVAFHGLWRVARNSSPVPTDVCGLVAILDSRHIASLPPKWQVYDPTCRLAFFRGQPNDYFEDIFDVVGAAAIVQLDYPRSFSECEAFMTSLQSLRIEPQV